MVMLSLGTFSLVVLIVKKGQSNLRILMFLIYLKLELTHWVKPLAPCGIRVFVPFLVRNTIH